MIDQNNLVKILSNYKYIESDDKWVSQRGRSSDKDKIAEVFLEYVKSASIEGQCSLPEFKQAAYELIQEEITKLRKDTEGFITYTHAAFAKLVRQQLKMEGSTWNCYRLDGRVVGKDRVQTACDSAVIKYNDAIPRIKGKKVCAPLSKADVWIEMTQIGDELETAGFRKLQQKLAFCPNLKYESLSSELFQLANIPDTDVNRVMLKHWIANTKRLIYGQKTLYDICLNLYGPQGTGKTTLSRFLTLGGVIPGGIKLPDGPVSKEQEVEGPLTNEYASEISFHKVFDDQFFAWASSYHALIVSEPAGEYKLYLDDREVNMFKDILERTEFTTRVFHTQKTQKTMKTFSMMTTTNKHLYRIISDPTGQRRIFELEMGSKDKKGNTVPPNSGLYVFPYLDLWMSVDETCSCISQDHRLWPDINKIWDTYKANSTIDLFFRYSKEYEIVKDPSLGVEVSLDDLYTHYSDWTKDNSYNKKQRDKFDEDLPSSGVIIQGDKAILKVRKSKKGFMA